MKVRTIEELNDKLSAELAWRKKEISTLTFLLQAAGSEQKAVVVRAAVAMVYAHWEGFVCSAAEIYLTFISARRITYRELQPCFAVATFKRRLRSAAASDRIASYIPLIEFLTKELDHPSDIPTTVSAQSNLTFHLFAEILSTLGLDHATYESKQHLIDDKLLHYRNNIAHGRALQPNASDFDELRENLLEMLESIRAQMERAATSASYRLPH